MEKLVNISELCKILNLIDAKTKKPLSHTLRYWEKEFIQISPKKINNQRYYSQKDIEIIKFIKTLIRDKKISIKGVKKILANDIKKLDDQHIDSLRIDHYKKNLKLKSKKILENIKKLKIYGKKNTP